MINNKSNPNSPNSNVALGSPSHLYGESSEGSSLRSQSGGPDTTIDYCEELGHTNFDVRSGWDHEMEPPPVQFGEVASYPPQAALPSVLPEGVSAQTLIDRFLATPPSPTAPKPPQHGMPPGIPEPSGEFAPRPSRRLKRTASKNSNLRQAPYANPYQAPCTHSGSHLQHSIMPGLPRQMEQNYLGLLGGQEQSQDAIWRNFIREFGLESLP